jgi:hypothetical protein
MYLGRWALGNCPAKRDREARRTGVNEVLKIEVITRPSGEKMGIALTGNICRHTQAAKLNQ